ncbi:unnamed protein product, partial [Pylaiella littoralis]
VEWRFLAHALDDQPGFSTAWLRQQSLKKQADSREREYKEQALHGFAEEFGMTSLFPAHPAKSAQERDNGGGEDDDDANDNADLKNTPVPSRMAPDAPSFHLDRQVPTEAIIWLAPPIPTVAEASPLPGLLVALKKGGVQLDEFQDKGGSNKQSEDTGEWDGVDLMSAPCLQQHLGGGGLSCPYLEDGGPSTHDAHGQDHWYHPPTAPKWIRPSTPPALLVYKPCLSVKIAEDIPSELEAAVDILETRANRLEKPPSTESARARPSNEEIEGNFFERSAKARLQIGLSMEQLSPKRPRGTRPSFRTAKTATRIRLKEASSETPITSRSSHSTPREPVGRPTQYGKAWYVNPELWGLESSPQVNSAALAEEDDNAEGAKKLEQHTNMMKTTIPGLFSAIRFATYIRQQGARMPAHLESTDRAMKAEKARFRKDAQARRMGDKDLEGSPEDQEVTSAAAPGASQKNRWRARVNAAVVLKKQ